MNDKKEMRQQQIKAAKNLSRIYCQQADQLIKEQLLALPIVQEATYIFCYVGMEQEINTQAIITELLAMGKHVCVPKTRAMGVMDAYEIKQLTDLSPAGKYQILEPTGETGLIAPQQIDVGLIPCVTADKTGYRLGYGGGFYDRYLEKSQMEKLLLCREQLLVPKVPTEEHDVPVDVLVTEAAVYYFS